MRHISENVSEDLDIHLVVDTYATLKHEKLRRWLGGSAPILNALHPHLFSWLNQVAIWLNIIIQYVIRRGSWLLILIVLWLITKIISRAFKWAATANSILENRHKLFCMVL
ncbi:MAG: hypothetical protein PHX53_03665 [Syntrophales bacterium]|nr:hypothetical protein [Syntrophales bacterium]